MSWKKTKTLHLLFHRNWKKIFLTKGVLIIILIIIIYFSIRLSSGKEKPHQPSLKQRRRNATIKSLCQDYKPALENCPDEATRNKMRVDFCCGMATHMADHKIRKDAQVEKASSTIKI